MKIFVDEHIPLMTVQALRLMAMTSVIFVAPQSKGCKMTSCGR
jgi:hypothetical protein